MEDSILIIADFVSKWYRLSDGKMVEIQNKDLLMIYRGSGKKM